MSDYPKTRAAMAEFDRREPLRAAARGKVKAWLRGGADSASNAASDWVAMLAGDLDAVRTAYVADTGDPRNITAALDDIRAALDARQSGGKGDV